MECIKSLKKEFPLGSKVFFSPGWDRRKGGEWIEKGIVESHEFDESNFEVDVYGIVVKSTVDGREYFRMPEELTLDPLGKGK
jgi:hypothetical protein